MPLIIVLLANNRVENSIEKCPSSALHCGAFDKNDKLY
jgi:hypothetical protein